MFNLCWKRRTTRNPSLTSTEPAVLLYSLMVMIGLVSESSLAQSAGSLNFTSVSYVVSEGDGVTGDPTQALSPPGAMVTVTRAGGSTGRVLVDCVITNGTATNGVHYTVSTNQPAPSVTNTLTLADSQTSTNFIISLRNDAITNATRTIKLILTNPRAAPGEDPALVVPILGSVTNANVSILDNDQGFNIERAVFRVNETDRRLSWESC